MYSFPISCLLGILEIRVILGGTAILAASGNYYAKKWNDIRISNHMSLVINI